MIEKETEIYRLQEKNGAQYLTFKAYDGYEELQHCFTTRFGGVSTGNYGTWNLCQNIRRDSPENIRKNYDILAEVMGTTPDRLVLTDQTHTSNIRTVTLDDLGKGVTKPMDYEDVDGLVTNLRGVGIVSQHADCNALFFYDPVKHVIGVAHSGWRGTLKRIGAVMLKRMADEFGSVPGDVIIGIGPSLCQDCFEVDEDVAEAFFDDCEEYRRFSYQKGIKYYLDLWAINRYILCEAGASDENVNCMGLCTKCHNDVFFSHRGQHGDRGNMAAFMMLI